MPLKKTINDKKKAQGEMQSWFGSQNRNVIFETILRKPSSFSELLQTARTLQSIRYDIKNGIEHSFRYFSEVTLWKHLKLLQSQGYIFKDTIKHGEKSNYPVGTVVYRVAPNMQRDFFEDAILRSLSFLTEMYWYNGETAKRISKEIARFVDSVTSIIIEDCKQMSKEQELDDK
jgi:hypothetical protein